jgi:pseudouridine-5'-phosphate glycosidase
VAAFRRIPPDGDVSGATGSHQLGPITVGAEVARARATGQPIVALESSVLAQGLPIPANREAEARMRAAIVARGAVPAVTAVVRGVPTLGLAGDDLERFLARDGVAKVSSRDLAPAMVQGRDGATTVAASLTLAAAAGLEVFATGGIGGVHREPAYDESADLLELASAPVITICAGAKSILDLPGTLERLDSYGVTVLGYRTDEFPGFFTAQTGLRVPRRVDAPAEIAAIYLASRALGRRSAILVVQPPPAEAALEAEVVDHAVTEALARARTAGIRGAAVTPFLLAAVEHATGGRSLAANLALLEANAALAAEIAGALARSGSQRV